MSGVRIEEGPLPRAEVSRLLEAVILSPSRYVILSEAKNLHQLRVNSAKNLHQLRVNSAKNLRAGETLR